MYCQIMLHAYHIGVPLTREGLLLMDFRDTYCEKAECAWWESNTGTCGMVTSSYLQGREVAIAEIRADMPKLGK